MTGKASASILKFDVMTARMYVVVTLTHDTMMKTGQDICGSHRRPSDQLLSENITQDWFPIPILQKGQWYRKHCLAVSQLRAL